MDPTPIPTISEVEKKLEKLIKTHRFNRSDTTLAFDLLSMNFTCIMTKDHFHKQHSNEMIAFENELNRLQQDRAIPAVEAELTIAMNKILDILKKYHHEFPQTGGGGGGLLLEPHEKG